MTFLGNQPTAVPLNADDLVDGIISEAKLAADAVSLAKMKAGVDGNIISYDASGNPAAVATGSSGQVLTSAGAGAPPTFSAAPSHTGNVQFPASQSASADVNNLDDYQEGTWTPVITATTNNHTYASQHGFYVKIGKFVHCHAHVVIDNLNSTSGNSRFGGLPFTASSTAQNYGTMIVAGAYSLNITAGFNMFGRVDLNETSGSFEILDTASGSTSIQFSELSADANIYLTVLYYV
jgi:hypothetical protein